MDKGVRVEIVKGRKGKGVVGTVFWIGEDKYKEGGKRVGIHGDDGETYWVSTDYVEETDAAPPEPSGPDPEKGDRVLWRQGDDAGEGEVFWVGPSKSGPGTRVGVKCDDDETRWFDSRALTLLSEDAPAAAAEEEDGPPGPVWDDEDPLF